jgi:hypothetical protein
MTIETQLREYILSKYKSIRNFSINADIPYSTIENILKRGISNAGISTMLKICNFLDIDIEELANGKIVKKTKDMNLDPHQKNVINEYIKQTDMQKAINRILKLDDEK